MNPANGLIQHYYEIPSGITSDWYYFENGIMQIGWIEVDDNLYHMDLVTGVMDKGLKELSGIKYYFDPTTGVLQTGWRTLNGDIYYFDPDNYGAAAIGWATIDGEYYYFGNDGVMHVSTWILDGTILMYYVDSTGKRLRGWVQLAYPEETAINWFYFNNPNDYNVAGLNSGQLARNKWIASGSNWYYVGQEGKMLTRSWIAADSTGNVWYFVLSDGKMAYSCQIHASDDLYYAFNSSGVCIDNSGSTTKYNETTYPLKEDYTE